MKKKIINKSDAAFKGQIISEQNCGVLNFPKKDFCPAMGQIRKMKAHYHAN